MAGRSYPAPRNLEGKGMQGQGGLPLAWPLAAGCRRRAARRAARAARAAAARAWRSSRSRLCPRGVAATIAPQPAHASAPPAKGSAAKGRALSSALKPQQAHTAQAETIISRQPRRRTQQGREQLSRGISQ
jgi:hypothetical protein